MFAFSEIVPALRAGFVVLTDRYIYSLMARAIARGEDRAWIERVASFALVPHAIYYLRAEVRDRERVRFARVVREQARVQRVDDRLRVAVDGIRSRAGRHRCIAGRYVELE